jgi:hypothetical protein
MSTAGIIPPSRIGSRFQTAISGKSAASVTSIAAFIETMLMTEQDKGPLGHAYRRCNEPEHAHNVLLDVDYCHHISPGQRAYCGQPASAHKAEERTLKVHIVAGSGDKAQSEENIDFTPTVDDPILDDPVAPEPADKAAEATEIDRRAQERFGPSLNADALIGRLGGAADKAGASLEQIAEAAVGPLEGIEIPYDIAIRMSTTRIVERIAPLVRAAEAAARAEEREECAKLCDKRARQQRSEAANQAEHYQDGGEADMYHADSIGAEALAKAIRALTAMSERS